MQCAAWFSVSVARSAAKVSVWSCTQAISEERLPCGAPGTVHPATSISSARPPPAARARPVSRRSTGAGQHEEIVRRAAPALRDAAEWLGHASHEPWLLACSVAHSIRLHHGKVPCAIAAAIEDTSDSLPDATGVECRGALREIAAEIRSDSVYVLVEDAALPDAAECAADGLPEETAIKGRGSTDFHAGCEWLDDPGEHPGRVPPPLR